MTESEGEQQPEAEIMIIPSEKALEPDLLEAIMMLQYGETTEESEAGFEKMKELASKESPKEEEP